ncbi:ferrochelatase [Janibacter sp. Soil728]|uniref:ferrochelatase n=1 Tax=Janibacter sp. Soil728 TaxID=1736393 RepID=UPI0006F278AD|nr:ferrochelatase [Janibacter sp. Soil728]KRE36870.1 ferrochelatase [Janibacter sp. Soil728]
MSDQAPEHPLRPYDAVMVQSFGGPEGPDEVLPFLRRVTAGRGVPDDRLAEVGSHYERVDGVSPLPALNRRLVADLVAELAARECPLPVVLGNRNSAPFVPEALDELTADGAQRILVVPTSAWRSYSSCRQYREGLADAAEGRGGLVLDKVRPFGEHPGFAATLARDTLAAARAAVDAVGADKVAIVYVTHSIPDAMDETSGPGDGEGRAYSADQAEVAAAITAEVDTVLGTDLPAGLAFCSRSGSPRTPWLEPDVNDRLRELAVDGVEHVVVVPIGFISDHMEVFYDLDVEAAATAAEVGLAMTRVPTPGGDHAFVAGLVDLMLERAAQARGEQPVRATWRDLDSHPAVCPMGCCPNLREARPALCGSD